MNPIACLKKKTMEPKHFEVIDATRIISCEIYYSY